MGRNENMNEHEKNIIADFVTGTPEWFNQMKKQATIMGNEDTHPCLYCGCDPKKMIELANAIKKLVVVLK